ncbi:MAG: DUF362 domain-containing protein [Desulfobaccales bacterium]
MSAMHGEFSKGAAVDSPLGQKKVDSEGAPISGVRMDVFRAYAGVPGLLQKVINDNDAAAWAEITNKIDYIYDNLDYSLAGLDRETGFAGEVQSQIKSGKKLLFKPNLVSPTVIDPMTHGEDLGAPICTEWPLMAALMRWFHDKLDLSYYQMTLGEASTATFAMASMYNKASGKAITTEAIIEGRSGDFYGGWGFYFVRRYLSERHPASHTDDPLRGFEDSVAGRFFPPGRAGDRLMVYDLNKIQDESSKGRTVAVPDGANFQEITLHKAIVGGDPGDPEDLRDYPGCILVNVPKLKIHFSDLITNAIKNLGIGLYPTMCAVGKGESDTSWKYSFPSTSVPTYKGRLPHMSWVPKIDADTNLPVIDEKGEYILTKTAGMPGTQSDVIRAVQGQKVFMLHVVDAIEMINHSHNPDGRAIRVPEGYIWSSLDCVALDLCCARYCFKTVPMLEGLKLKEENGWPTEFVHHVPVARVEGGNIVTGEGLDSPLFRYNLYRYAESRGVGQQNYYVVGWDSLTDTPLTSLMGHLGRIDNRQFLELMTKTMYFNVGCLIWDMQKTILSYAQAHDDLTGSSLFKEFMDSFDENNDGVIDYDENGRRGYWTALFSILGYVSYLKLTVEYGSLKGPFYEIATPNKAAHKNWNPQGHDWKREYMLEFGADAAFDLSQSAELRADLFVPGMTYGRGRWPSWQTVTYMLNTAGLYGSNSPNNVSLQSLYGLVFQYADKALNGGSYTGSKDAMRSEPNALHNYFKAVSEGAAPLNFTLYVPVGYGSLETVKMPNVEETEDPNKILTADFNGGQEVW